MDRYRSTALPYSRLAHGSGALSTLQERESCFDCVMIHSFDGYTRLSVWCAAADGGNNDDNVIKNKSGVNGVRYPAPPLGGKHEFGCIPPL